MDFLGISWVGVDAENGRKLLLSLAFVALVLLGSAGLRALLGRVLGSADHSSIQAKFWMRQGVSLFAAVLLILGLLSIWFNDPARLGDSLRPDLRRPRLRLTAGGDLDCRLLRHSARLHLTVGDRISMGGVRDDVMRLGFIQTTIMEMGEPPSAQGADPAMWVKSRQFTGRIVTVTNSKIFAEPVFNHTRDFPVIWEEMPIPNTYQADRGRAEAILLEAARLHATSADAMAAEAKQNLEQRFGVQPVDLEPRVFYRITDNWLELTVRFIVGTHKIRNAKDAMSRHIIAEFDKAGIGIASATYDIVGFPAVRIERSPAQTDQPPLPA